MAYKEPYPIIISLNFIFSLSILFIIYLKKYFQPALKALIELGRTGKQNCAFGVVSTLVNLTNSYDKQEIDPQMIELAKFAKHHIPEEHELDDEDFADKRTDILGRLGVTSALVSLSKTESENLRELIARVLNALCKNADLR